MKIFNAKKKIVLLFFTLISGLIFQNCKTSKITVNNDLGVFVKFAGTIDLDLLAGNYKGPYFYSESNIRKAIQSNENPFDYAIAWSEEDNFIITFDKNTNQGSITSKLNKYVFKFEFDKSTNLLKYTSGMHPDYSNTKEEIIILNENMLRILSTDANGVKDVTEYERN